MERYDDTLGKANKAQIVKLSGDAHAAKEAWQAFLKKARAKGARCDASEEDELKSKLVETIDIVTADARNTQLMNVVMQAIKVSRHPAKRLKTTFAEFEVETQRTAREVLPAEIWQWLQEKQYVCEDKPAGDPGVSSAGSTQAAAASHSPAKKRKKDKT